MSTARKRFDIALSFPGEHREFVAKVAQSLKERLGKDRILYDEFYEAEFARIDLDTHLQRLYRDESELIVIFLCADYERKRWCKLEWRAIKDLIATKESSAIMPIRFDRTEIPGLFSGDSAVEVNGRTPEEIANLILDRWKLRQSEIKSKGAEGVVPTLRGTKERRRIDAMAPGRAALGETIRVLVQVRRLDSPQLGMEDWPSKQKPESLESASTELTVFFPQDRKTGETAPARLRIRLNAPDFKVKGPTEQALEIPPEGDSQKLFFLLMTRRRGRCPINIDVFAPRDRHLGTIPVETHVNGAAQEKTAPAAASLVLVVVVPDQPSVPEPIPTGLARVRATGGALETWRTKLDYLEQQEAITSDPAKKFELAEQIEEARAKIREHQAPPSQGLGAVPESSGPPPITGPVARSVPEEPKPQRGPATIDNSKPSAGYTAGLWEKIITGLLGKMVAWAVVAGGVLYLMWQLLER